MYYMSLGVDAIADLDYFWLFLKIDKIWGPKNHPKFGYALAKASKKPDFFDFDKKIEKNAFFSKSPYKRDF